MCFCVQIKFFREDGDEWICSETLSSHESTVWAISFDASGDRLASCSEDKTVKVWARARGAGSGEGASQWKPSCALSGFHDRAVYDVDWCGRTGLMATAAGDNDVRIFREEKASPNGETSFSLAHCEAGAHSQDVNAVKWNPAEEGEEGAPRLLASCSDDGTVKLWLVEAEADDVANT